MFETLFGAEMPLAVRFFLAFVIFIFFGAVLVYFARARWRRWTLSRAGYSGAVGNDIEKSISEVVHETYDHGDTDRRANSGLTEQLRELAKLHADDALTDDEFKALKAKLIGGERKQPLPAITRERSASGMRATWGSTVSRAVGQSVYVILLYTSVPVIILVAIFFIFTPSVGLFHNLPTHDAIGPDLNVQTTTATNLLGLPVGVVKITNVGSKTVSIEDVVLNGRPECAYHEQQSVVYNPPPLPPLPRWQDDPAYIAAKKQAYEVIEAEKALGVVEGITRDPDQGGGVSLQFSYAWISRVPCDMGPAGGRYTESQIEHRKIQLQECASTKRAEKAIETLNEAIATASNRVAQLKNERQNEQQNTYLRLQKEAPLLPITATLRTGDALTVRPLCQTTVSVTVQTNLGTVSFHMENP